MELDIVCIIEIITRDGAGYCLPSWNKVKLKLSSKIHQEMTITFDPELANTLFSFVSCLITVFNNMFDYRIQWRSMDYAVAR